MTAYGRDLPQLRDQFFLTDGGIETTLIFLEGLELPDFAVFDLLKPAELATMHARLKQRLPHFTVMAGCCGTDVRHVERIAAACSRS